MRSPENLLEKSSSEAEAASNEAPLFPVITYFTQNAEKNPDHVALVDKQKEYSYGYINNLANQLAHKILAIRGVKEEPVLFLFGKEAGAPVSVLAIWKASKFYVGLDPSNPPERLKAIIADTKAKLLISNNANLALAQQVSQGHLEIINFDELDGSIPSENPSVPVDLESLCAVWYTSGSTGEPKGVTRDHYSLSLQATFIHHDRSHKSDDRFLTTFSFAFGWAISSFHSAFLSGGTLYLCDLSSMTVMEIARFLIDNKISSTSLTSSMFRQFVESLPEEFSGKFIDLRILNVGGETRDPNIIAEWNKRFSPTSISAGFASSEAGIITRVSKDAKSDIPEGRVDVGRPFRGVEVFIMDDSGNDLGKNQIGRIAVKSKMLMRGYWGKPELDSTLFVPDPRLPGEKILLTSDLGRLYGDGSLEFLGRSDAMIKIRGFRVEPGEVESAIRKHPAVKNAVVVGWPKPKPEDEMALVAYLVSKPDMQVLPSQLSEFLVAHLPNYMVPAYYVFLEQLPLNANGKIDRKALSEPNWAALPSENLYVAPRTENEKYLTLLWQEVLGKEKVGIHDDFFMLGGHSLAAFRMMSRIEEKLGIKVPLQTLVQHPTIAALAPVIQTMRSAPMQSSVVELRGGTLPALFIVSGGARTALSSTKFARQIQNPCKVYGLEYPGMDGYLKPLDRIESLASFFVEQIHAVQPRGPYYLGGFCLGGAIVFEIAHQLKAQGQEIGLVVLLDSTPPGMKDEELDNQGNWYYFERMKTLFHPENRRNAVSFIKSRLQRNKRFGNGARSRGMPARGKARINQPSWIKNPLDEQSRQVMTALRRAWKKNYRPKPLEAPGLAILSSVSKGTAREAWWSRLFTEFDCRYIPNTTHHNIFSDESLLEMARLVSQSMQPDQESAKL